MFGHSFSLLLFSHLVMSNSLQPHGLQHARLPCPSPSTITIWVCSNLHRVSHAIQPSCPLSYPSPPAFNFPSIRVCANKLALLIRWPKYWNFSFSISPSIEYSELISLRIDWFDLLAVQGTHLESHWRRILSNITDKSINSSAFSFLYGPTLTSIYDY